MRIGIVGGQLQGLEAAYLSQEAGFHVGLIDRDDRAPAQTLADEFYPLDLLDQKDSCKDLLRSFDFILPATETYETLSWLHKASSEWGFCLGLDLASYRISVSKIQSNSIFENNGISIPIPWPRCGFPLIIKPSHKSGSTGVMRIDTSDHFNEISGLSTEEHVIQEYVEGPSYSLEVMAHQGRAVCFQVTLLEFDGVYDCKRAVAGPHTGEDIKDDLCAVGETIAEAISLSGIMDVEVIKTESGLKILEIDARLPSQTPTAVYHATGMNMVKALAEYWISGTLPEFPPGTGHPNAVIYEHYRCRNGVLETAGEHILRGVQGLQVYGEIFSATRFLSNFEQFPDEWVATAVFVDRTESLAWDRRRRAVREMMKEFNCRDFADPGPP